MKNNRLIALLVVTAIAATAYLVAASLFRLIGDSYIEVQPSSAQPVGPTGLPRVLTIDGGLCSGKGTSTDPLTCAVSVDNTTITGTGSSGSPLAASVVFDGGYFCDGSDGSVTFDGSSVVLGLTPSANVYTMTRDICCASCTINSGVTLRGGWRFFDSGTLTLDGKIARNGSNGTNGSTSGSLGGAGAVGASDWYGAASAGGNGGLAGAGAIGGSCSGPSENGLCVTNTAAAGANGNTCGGGGGGTGGSAGGTGGAVTATTIRISGMRTIVGALDGLINMIGGADISCASGGGGGGGVAGAAGGGGGGGGGFTFVGAKRITGSGSVEAVGGNGGNGNAAGNTGGGGGGGGGLVTVLIGFGSFPTITVSGGTGGNPNGTGAAGGNGGAGAAIQLRMGN